jgi:hypothetical protein
VRAALFFAVVFRTFKSFFHLVLKTAFKASLPTIFNFLPWCSGCSEVFRFQKTEHPSLPLKYKSKASVDAPIPTVEIHFQIITFSNSPIICTSAY